MKKTILAIACTALAAPMAFAQAKNFEGLSIGANIANTKTTVEDTTASIDGTTTGLDLNAQYNWALNQEFVLGLGLTVGLGNNKVGNTATAGDIITKNRTSLELVPGFAVSKDILIYGKIASISATGANDVGFSDTFSGIGYGFGVRGMVDKSIYWQAGYDLNQYQEKNNNKLKSSVFSLGVGYKF